MHGAAFIMMATEVNWEGAMLVAGMRFLHTHFEESGTSKEEDKRPFGAKQASKYGGKGKRTDFSNLRDHDLARRQQGEQAKDTQ